MKTLLEVAAARLKVCTRFHVVTFISCSVILYSNAFPQVVSPNIRVHPNPTTHQFETSITTHPSNPNIVLISANAGNTDQSVSSLGWYYTTDGGTTWSGSDTLPGHSNFTTRIGDPAVGIDLDGNLYLNGTSGTSSFGIIVTHSTNGGASWSQTNLPVSNNHKNHLAIDLNPSSAYSGNVYTSYATIMSAPIRFSRSTDGGESFSFPTSIDGSIGSPNTNGPNLAVGPNGELYATWVGTGNPGPLGFNVSTDGGVSWGAAKSIRTVKNVQYVKGVNYGRSLPSMAVDRSERYGRRGWMYLVYAENNPIQPDIFLIRSTDGGVTWSDSVKVNQDSGGNDQWLPWISVDPSTGFLYVAYYDSRNFTANDSAEVYVSWSGDGGETFQDVRVSDVPFKPATLPVFPNYGGAYIGVTALQNTVWICWYDNRTGIFQVYASRLTGINAVERISSQIPSLFSLGQNYPNPFNPSTTIQFSVVGSQFTVLKIFDLLGREVATLVNEELRPGNYEVTWDASGFPSGTYFYTLTAGAFTETKKLMLLK